MSDGPLGFGDDEAPRPAPPSPKPSAPAPPPRRRRPSSSRLPGIVVVGAGLILLALVGINTLRTQGASSTGPPAGERMPPFAAPLARSSIDGDVNVARARGQGQAGTVPACSVRGAGILNSCDLVRGAPVALAFFLAGRSRCVAELDALAAAAGGHPRVRVAAVALGGDRADVRRLVRDHGWRFPVAWDRDAVLANLYGVAVCPQITYLEPGGIVRDTTVGSLGRDALARRLASLEAASR